MHRILITRLICVKMEVVELPDSLHWFEKLVQEALPFTPLPTIWTPV